MPALDCVSAVNLISAENGLRGRFGYREWCTGLTGTTTDEVRSVLPFSGSTPASGKLFVTTESSIWDVSASSTTPPDVYTFATPTGLSGHGNSAVFVTAAGHFLLYCDEANGLHVYSESGASWTAVTQGTGPTQIDGFNPARAAFVAVFKNRVWLVERDTADAWYLPVGQIYGTATRFPFGTVFREGGALVGLWNWTYDGGAGLDDSLVAISSGGDVAVYQGTDPASASAFGLRGVWQIGTPPSGRRIASTYGGELLLLSRQGLIPLSRLVVGAIGSAEYATAKIANLINRIMLEKASLRDWGIVLHPEDNALLLLVPKGTGSTTLQLAQSSASRGWFSYTALPILSANAWEGRLYFGTDDGRVCVNTGYLDAVPLADPSAYDPVEWSVLGAFSNLGSPRQKRVSSIRPLLLSDGVTPSYVAAARFDYNQAEIDAVELVLTGDGALWDTAVWDEDVWGGAAAPAYASSGASGMGVNVAVAIRGTSIARTVLVGVDVAYTQGGFF
jgi:hypothetical protein